MLSVKMGLLVTADISSVDVASVTSDSPRGRSKFRGIPEVSLFTDMILEGNLSLIGHFLDVGLL